MKYYFFFLCILLTTTIIGVEVNMVLVPIVEKYEMLTSSEQKIADYIISNPLEAIELTAEKLAEKSNTSPATVVRFAKKIGYDSLNEMKIGLARNLHSTQYLEKDMIVKPNDSESDCAQKLLAQITDVCKATINNLDYVKFEKAIKELDEADSIFLFGTGSSGNIALDIRQKLTRIKKRVFYMQDNQINMFSTLSIRKKDVVLCFSFSGNTKIIETSVKAAKEQGAFVIVVTGNTKSPIGKLADICILSPAIERKLRIGAVSSRYAQQYIADLIFLCLIARHYEEAEQLTLRANQLLNNSMS